LSYPHLQICFLGMERAVTYNTYLMVDELLALQLTLAQAREARADLRAARVQIEPDELARLVAALVLGSIECAAASAPRRRSATSALLREDVRHVTWAEMLTAAPPDIAAGPVRSPIDDLR